MKNRFRSKRARLRSGRARMRQSILRMLACVAALRRPPSRWRCHARDKPGHAIA
jgi:hypothetical protein